MPENSQKSRMRWSPLLFNAAAIVVIIGGLKLAAPIVTQVLLIAFITIIIAPVYFRLVDLRLPSWLALTFVVVSLSVLVIFGLYALSNALTQFAKNIPTYHRGIENLIDATCAWFASQDVPLPVSTFDNIINTHNVTLFARDVATFGGRMLGRGFIILLIVIFMLCEVAVLPSKIKKMPWITDELYEKLLQMTSDVRHYMGIKTVISAFTGVVIYIGLVLLRVESAFLLGLLAFVLNYVPSIGSVLAAIPALLIAYIGKGNVLAGGMDAAIAVAAIYLVVNQVFGNIIEPKVMGRGFGVSPVVILLSMLFWAWVLGLVGMLLSVPLTMGVRVMVMSLHKNAPSAASSSTTSPAPKDELK